MDIIDGYHLSAAYHDTGSVTGQVLGYAIPYPMPSVEAVTSATFPLT